MKNYLLLALMILSFKAMAQVGFKDPRDPSLPAPLKKASDSVFEIRAAFISDTSELSDMIVVDISTEEQKRKVLAAIEKSTPDKKDRQIMMAFLNRCVRQELQDECYIPTHSSAGSGFITGNGATLWTNAHVLEKMLITKAETNETTLESIFKSKSNMPLFIFNKDGELIFDGLKDEVSFKAIPARTNLTVQRNNFYAEDSDYIALDLGKTLGTPLKLASKPLPGEGVVVMGYPECTGCQAPEGSDPLEYEDRGAGKNADGCHQRLSSGTVLMAESFGNLADVNKVLIAMMDKESFIASTADSQHGMSGGPILNKNGEVIGLHTGGKTIKRNGPSERYSRGVVPPMLHQIN